MIRNILVQFFAARKIKIFSKKKLGHFEPILDLFRYQKQVFGPIFDKKLKLCTESKYKVDETQHTGTVFHCKKDENIFGSPWGHFELIRDLFRYQKQVFGPIFDKKLKSYTESKYKVDATQHTGRVFHCKKDENLNKKWMKHNYAKTNFYKIRKSY